LKQALDSPRHTRADSQCFQNVLPRRPDDARRTLATTVGEEVREAD
jgi:hypothetical protein